MSSIMSMLSCCFSSMGDKGGVLSQITAIVKDPSLLVKPVDMAFSYFDKDKNGYIDVRELTAAANFVSQKLGLPAAPTPAVKMAFDKVSGTDGRIDRQEFVEALKKMFHLAKEQQAQGAPPARA